MAAVWAVGRRELERGRGGHWRVRLRAVCTAKCLCVFLIVRTRACLCECPAPRGPATPTLAKPIALGDSAWRSSLIKGRWARAEWRARAVGAPGPRFRERQPKPRGRRSESPSGAVATAALFWLSLWSESAARVPEAELKPPPNPEWGCPRARGAGKPAGASEGPVPRTLQRGLRATAAGVARGSAGRPGLPQPQLFVCVCLAA